MKVLIPYFTIKGRAEEALRFYEACFGGSTIFIQRYADTHYEVSDGYKQKIAHAEFRSEDIHFYISDGFEHEASDPGNSIGMTVNFSNADEHRATFDKLKQGGTVTFDFFRTTLGTTLVCVLDRFGIHWYMNLEH